VVAVCLFSFNNDQCCFCKSVSQAQAGGGAIFNALNCPPVISNVVLCWGREQTERERADQSTIIPTASSNFHKIIASLQVWKHATYPKRHE
jgi:hypothetical protein